MALMEQSKKAMEYNSNLALAKEIKLLQESEDNPLKQKNEGKQKETAQAQIIPVAQHILKSSPFCPWKKRTSFGNWF